MIHDLDMLEAFYSLYQQRVAEAKEKQKKSFTLTEKILYAHLFSNEFSDKIRRGEDYANFRPDRVAMQDATAQMALLQFMNAGKEQVAVPSTVHCDHLILAHSGVEKDLPEACAVNAEVYDFLQSAASRYGIGFWKPGAGIIHQVVLENYAFPGGMMVGTDSHTPNAGGMGMLAIGVGGADAVDVMTGMEWELKMPRIIGVRLTGKLSSWASPKDVILKLAGILTVKGGTNAIIEYFGEGTNTLSATGKATICNMGAEVGATTSVFPFDSKMAEYLSITGREKVAQMAMKVSSDLCADKEVEERPELYYDRIIDINLSELEPFVNGPFTPDAATEISKIKTYIKENNYPETVDVALIGSCTNSSYQDLSRAASVVRCATEMGLKPKAQIIVNPGSNKVCETAQRDGILDTLRSAGAIVMTNACGPCIGQWKRDTEDNTRRNSIVTSFNRNFAKRADGNPNTHAFITSPELAMAFAFAGTLSFNPLTDTIKGEKGEVRLVVPQGEELPSIGFASGDDGYIAPNKDTKEVIIKEGSTRLQKLLPFQAFCKTDYIEMPLLIKVKGKCTTDHISMAGPWLKFRGHLENISGNMLMGATNAFSGETNSVKCSLDGSIEGVSEAAKVYKEAGKSSIIVAEENYGEGSSREHAAMEPRFLGVKVILSKSFARIHETNLKKQGMLALTFKNKDDYDKIKEADLLSVTNVENIKSGENINVGILHADGSRETIEAVHSYNEQQIAWLKAGSALNYMNNE